MTRRTALSSLLATPLALKAQQASAPPSAIETQMALTRERRIQWWKQARFGMFIHWGLYSVRGRHEWVMENEAIPVTEYEQLA
jgi:alpha-L-fucosidase